MAELFADYKALKDRQNNHGAIWRFFHSKENQERNNLLKQMEDVMKKKLPDNVFEKIETPLDIIKYQKWGDITKGIDIFMTRRDFTPEIDFGYSAYQENPALYEAYIENAKNNDAKNEKELFNGQLKMDTSDNVASKSEHNTEPPVRTPKNKITGI